VADEKKNLQTLVDHLVLQAMAERLIKTRIKRLSRVSNALRSRRGDRSTKGIL
jgi:hypothetical protein